MLLVCKKNDFERFLFFSKKKKRKLFYDCNQLYSIFNRLAVTNINGLLHQDYKDFRT
jgi:hypothetical protein